MDELLGKNGGGGGGGLTDSRVTLIGEGRGRGKLDVEHPLCG